MKIARATQAILDPDGEWRNKTGRRSKAFDVVMWRREHKEGKKIDCSRETGIDYKTVLKWWDTDIEKAFLETNSFDILQIAKNVLKTQEKPLKSKD